MTGFRLFIKKKSNVSCRVSWFPHNNEMLVSDFHFYNLRDYNICTRDTTHCPSGQAFVCADDKERVILLSSTQMLLCLLVLFRNTKSASFPFLFRFDPENSPEPRRCSVK